MGTPRKQDQQEYQYNSAEQQILWGKENNNVNSSKTSGTPSKKGIFEPEHKNMPYFSINDKNDLYNQTFSGNSHQSHYSDHTKLKINTYLDNNGTHQPLITPVTKLSHQLQGDYAKLGQAITDKINNALLPQQDRVQQVEFHLKDMESNVMNIQQQLEQERLKYQRKEQAYDVLLTTHQNTLSELEQLRKQVDSIQKKNGQSLYFTQEPQDNKLRFEIEELKRVNMHLSEDCRLKDQEIEQLNITQGALVGEIESLQNTELSLQALILQLKAEIERLTNIITALNSDYKEIMKKNDELNKLANENFINKQKVEEFEQIFSDIKLNNSQIGSNINQAKKSYESNNMVGSQNHMNGSAINGSVVKKQKDERAEQQQQQQQPTFRNINAGQNMIYSQMNAYNNNKTDETADKRRGSQQSYTQNQQKIINKALLKNDKESNSAFDPVKKKPQNQQ